MRRRYNKTCKESNWCRERLERDSLGTFKFRQLHRNNQREKTSKDVSHSHNQPGNLTAVRSPGIGWEGPEHHLQPLSFNVASPCPPGQGKGTKLLPQTLLLAPTPSHGGLSPPAQRLNSFHSCYRGRTLGKDSVFLRIIKLAGSYFN